MKFVLSILLFQLGTACDRDDKNPAESQPIEFSEPVSVTITGYTGHVMEPFLSRDGSILLFNNLNEPSENTNLHWAQKINDSLFLYKGEITGVNTTDLDAVPGLDSLGNLYFVSTRNYAATLSTIYTCRFSNGIASDVQLVAGISRTQPSWLNFDVEVSADGQTLYFADGQFNQPGLPQSADLIIAHKNGAGFQRNALSNELMSKINSPALEYAACISANQLELYFTRLELPITASSSPAIFVSTRQHINQPFGKPSKVESISGFAEAATIAPDQKTVYFHKKVNDRYELYFVRKK